MHLAILMRSGFLDRAIHGVLAALEIATMVLLVVLVVFAILGLVMQVGAVTRPPFLAGETLTHVLDDVLGVFVLIELLAVAAAYVRGTEILRRVFEAVFVAIARKLIVMELAEKPLQKAASVGILLIAAGVASWLALRARPLHKPAPAP